MTSGTTINVAVVGLEFGRGFVPIYLEHPNVGEVGICDARPDRLEEVGEQLAIAHRYRSVDDVLADDRWDAVHIVTPVSTHADFAAKVLTSGRHCACAVPMATTEADIVKILEAERISGKRYMMMETMVFSREYLYVRGMHEAGQLGELTFLRGAHIQDLDGFARYWWGYPPMHYITHAISPLLDIAQTHATHVSCLGSGALPDVLRSEFGNPWPLETAHFRLADGGVGSHNLAAEVTMAFFRTARPYVEGFSVYGDSRSFEWGQVENEVHLVYEFLPLEAGKRGRRARVTEVNAPDRPDLLPHQLAVFTETTEYKAKHGARGPVVVRNDHGSSHPHLVHDFVSSIVEGRSPRVPGWLAANWTLPGIKAHESAMAEGEWLDVPNFRPAS
jgi:predicted dehydrogenase